MDDKRLRTLEQLKQFVASSQGIEFNGLHLKEKYHWTEEVLKKFKYPRLKKAGKGVIRQYVQKVTGYSRAQVNRLIWRYQQSGKIKPTEYCRHRFPQKYTLSEVALLAMTDELHGWLSGPATKKILEREYGVYGHNQFQNLAGISVAQIYNLRQSKRYRGKRFTHTRPVSVRIGERAKPETQGQPGHIRIDTVHQGDHERQKGVYHINAVDEVTQWEIVASVSRIAEYDLAPLLENMLNQFPFQVRGFHSDNGSEYVNRIVARLLNRLLIRFTRSRPRRSNDNGLVESKNGAVIRKNLGYMYIPQSGADLLNVYHRDNLNPYINFHRPCFFPVVTIDEKGKVKKKYPYEKIKTPYEKLKSLPRVETYLRPGITLDQLDAVENQMSDNKYAERMVKARSKLFKQTDSCSLVDESNRLRSGSSCIGRDCPVLPHISELP
ncbi:MAG: DDE-type integrase/transposase/recombinase [Dehalococcoidia bacterium]|nr:DDE-type integrase/transposase/recombinase [Dehalococcoidia bacterium]